jgi:hypothetical protein
LFLRNFTVVTLTIFSIKSLHLEPSRNPRYLCSQTYFCPSVTVACSRLLKQSGDAKRTVRNDLVLTFVQFLYSPFFSFKLLFLRRLHDLRYLCSQTYFCPETTVACSRLLQQSGDAKRMVRNNWVLMFVQFFYSPFFQLNYYVWGDCVICDISAYRRIFAPRPQWTILVNKKNASMQKEQ